MEVVIPIHTTDFDFGSAVSSPVHLSAPSTPKRLGEYYFSAPASPSRIFQFYREFDDFLISSSGNSSKTGGGSCLAVPFDWEEKPGTPKSPKGGTENEDDFAFEVSEDFETASLSAEELFDGGVIKPLKPPPRLQLPSAARINDDSVQIGSSSGSGLSPTSPGSSISKGKNIIMGAFSPRHKKDFDPFVAAAQQIKTAREAPERERGGERYPGLSTSRRRATRSLSPFRVSQYPWEEEEKQKQEQEQEKQNKTQYSTAAKPSSSSSSTSCPVLSNSSSKGSRKWSLKNFFLFRSASEGRASEKDPLKKYTAAFRRCEEVKISSSRTAEIPASKSFSRRRSRVSAHELHYTANRSVSEDLKKKTFLPYKQGILGRLAFNPAVHALANGFGFSRK